MEPDNFKTLPNRNMKTTQLIYSISILTFSTISSMATDKQIDNSTQSAKESKVDAVKSAIAKLKALVETCSPQEKAQLAQLAPKLKQLASLLDTPEAQAAIDGKELTAQAVKQVIGKMAMAGKIEDGQLNPDELLKELKNAGYKVNNASDIFKLLGAPSKDPRPTLPKTEEEEL